MSMPLPSALNPLAKALLIRHSLRPQRALSRIGLGLALSTALVAQVQAQEWTLDIPAQSMNAALQALAQQTDTQLLYSPEDISGLRSSALKGRHDLQSSLRTLLQGTGLRYQIDGNTVTVTAAANGEGQMELSPTSVNSHALGATTEGTGSYTTGVTNTATKMNLSLRETPQSISVITRQRMDDQQLHSMTDVLTQTPGITMSQDGGERFNIYSRGSQINTYQIDGVTTTQENQTRTLPSTFFDTALYDRIEVVRGATGLMTGAGDPSGVVNIIHKRPTRHFQSYVQAGVGSWDYNRLEADVSGPLTDSGNVRGRFVAAKQDNNSFMDWYSQRKDIVYGVVEADVTDTTLVRFGVDYQKYKANGAPGVPLMYSNGQQTHFSRSTSSGARWAFDDYETLNYTLNFEQKLANDWEFKVAANYMDVDRDFADATYETASGSSTLDPVTLEASADIGKAHAEQVQKGVDVTLQGPFELLGQTHDLIFGWNWNEYNNDHFSALGTGSNSFNFGSWDNYIDKPDSYNPLLDFNINSRQSGYFAATRLNFTDQLHLILGARGTNYSYNYYSKVIGSTREPVNYHIGETGVVTPYAGLVYDLTPEQSVYVSYTDIFKPQSARDIEGKVLDPVLGKNYEMGWKGEFFDSRLNASAAVYWIERDNLAERTGQTIPDSTNGEEAYKAVNGAKTRGVDLELSGEILPGWNVQTGYSYSRTENGDGDRMLTQLPMDSLRFWTTYRLPGEFDKLTVGGGLNWNSGTSLYFSSYKTRATQDDYYVASLMARYQITDHLSTTLNLNNLFDEKYYAGFAGNYGHYGAPRNAQMNLRYDF